MMWLLLLNHSEVTDDMLVRLIKENGEMTDIGRFVVIYFGFWSCIAFVLFALAIFSEAV